MIGNVDLSTQPPTVHTQPRVRILVADEDPAIRRLLRAALTRQGYQVYENQSLRNIFRALHHFRPDILIIDPDLKNEGIALVSSIRKRWPLLPILVLSECKIDAVTVTVLDEGADDYVTKPFGVEELSARIRAAMRHIMQPHALFSIGDLSVDLMQHAVTRNREMIRLTPVEYSLLKTLIAHAGEALTAEQLSTELWGSATADKIRRLRVHMSNLRSKLEPDPTEPKYILTHPGLGYRLRSADQAARSPSGR